MYILNTPCTLILSLRYLHSVLNFYYYTVKKIMICNHNIFSFVKSTEIIYVVQITSYVEFLMVKSISFIVLTFINIVFPFQ